MAIGWLKPGLTWFLLLKKPFFRCLPQRQALCREHQQLRLVLNVPEDTAPQGVDFDDCWLMVDMENGSFIVDLPINNGDFS